MSFDDLPPLEEVPQTPADLHDLMPGVVYSRQAVNRAIKRIKDYHSGAISPMPTRFLGLNNLLGGGFYLQENYLIAGISGTGKTSLMAIIREDLSKITIDGQLPIVLMFYFESSPEIDVIKTAQSVLHETYSELHSIGRVFSEQELLAIESALNSTFRKNVLYVEEACTPMQAFDFIKIVAAKYPKRPIVALHDHTGLYSPTDREDEFDVIKNISAAAIAHKKSLPLTNIFFAQLNSNIEDPKRIANPSMHIPTRSDIYGSKSIFNAMEGVIVLHAPEKLNMPYYTVNNLPTLNRIYAHQIKGRYTGTGYIEFDSVNLKHNILTEVRDAS